MIVPVEAVLEKLKPLASNWREAMEKKVPPVTATSKPSATLPSVLSSSPQVKVPFSQASVSPSPEHSAPAIPEKAVPLKKEAEA